jgi:hypothetical protein
MSSTLIPRTIRRFLCSLYDECFVQGVCLLYEYAHFLTLLTLGNPVNLTIVDDAPSLGYVKSEFYYLNPKPNVNCWDPGNCWRYSGNYSSYLVITFFDANVYQEYTIESHFNHTHTTTLCDTQCMQAGNNPFLPVRLLSPADDVHPFQQHC